MIPTLAALATGYLLGSLPVAAWLARLKGADVFKVGSGNMGAMNTARNLGMGLGVLVLLLDVAKGAVASLLGSQIANVTAATLPADGQLAELSGVPLSLALPLVAGFGAVLGHAYSMFVRFRGGKALATTLGVSLPLYPQVGLAGLVLIIALYLITRRSGLAGVITMLVYPALAFLTLERAGWLRTDTFAVVTATIAIASVVVIKHVSAWLKPPAATANVP